MTTASGERVRALPLVAVLYRVPLFVEALRVAFEGIAELQPVPVAEAEGLVRWLAPQALVIDGEPPPFALEAGIPIVTVDLEEPNVTLHAGGTRRTVADSSPAAVRDAVLAGLMRGSRS